MCKHKEIKMDSEKVVKAFNDFTDEKYADSEDTLRSEIKQAVNDHLKDKLDLKNDPITQKSSNDEDE